MIVTSQPVDEQRRFEQRVSAGAEAGGNVEHVKGVIVIVEQDGWAAANDYAGAMAGNDAVPDAVSAAHGADPHLSPGSEPNLLSTMVQWISELEPL